MIEDYITENVLPMYANTHTEQTHTGRSTSDLRLQSRNFIRDFVGGEDIKVIFCGSGSTACLNKLVSMFRLKEKHVWHDGLKFNFMGKFKTLFKSQKPVVFISSQEHHSNLIPWRRGTFVDLVMIKSMDGLICLEDLEEKLKKYYSRPLKIGSFTAGSNVVGVLMNTDEISTLLHKYGAFAVWDYAGVGAYTPICMNPKDSLLGYKDAIVLSPHKMIGGPQTPGILVIQSSTLKQMHLQKPEYTPSNVGGGIVDFVGQETEEWIKNLEELEEAGTPAIIESIR
jgi:selenocysteine lyase/cysteine desulfurase